ncbi:MAG: methyltransferase domain-containing protein [Lachnospiraceae bacterium]|nr:methyltransferase domain-containing protein [Lachnospiraceae bacterium]
MTDSYRGFAGVYDLLMDNVPYDKWAQSYVSILKEYGIDEGLICDLGCGTGNMTLRFKKAGYDMIGIDDSEDMLDIARKKDDDGNILFLLQDMCSFELYGTVRAVTCVCDSVNYLLDEKDMLELFLHVNNYLDPGGIFIFDFNTDDKYRDLYGDSVIAENREDVSFIWENEYDPESGINECALTVFARTQNGLFERFNELHLQRGYSLDVIKRLLKEAGMEFLSAGTLPDADGMSEEGRILVIARERGKEK